VGAPEGELWNVDKSCLAEAYRIDPKSPAIMTEYGLFIWNYDLNRELGKKLIERALQLDISNPRVHVAVALVYLAPNTRYTNVDKAISELQIAIRLDPTYAAPHHWLISAYGCKSRLADAEREKAIEKSLTSYADLSEK
jgi:tetratricopeptide (TPR) repeat protein